jgi:hypothetical protein
MHALRHAVRPVVVALSFGLSGCTPFTKALWGEPDRKLVVVEERRSEGAAEVRVEERVPEGLWVRDVEPGRPAVLRWLSPGEQGDLALVLLAGGGPTVQEVAVREQRRSVDDRLVSAEAEVDVQIRCDPATMAQLIRPAVVTEAALAAMAPVYDNAFTSFATQHLPPDLAFCVERLRTCDLAEVVAAPPGTVRPEAWVFVAADGSPRHHADDVARPVPAAESWSARGDRLAEHTLLLRVARGDALEYWQVRTDLWFWWAHTEGDSLLRTHRSRWLREPAAVQVRQPVEGPFWRPAQLAVHEIRSELRHDERSLLVKILLTPFAVVLDAGCTIVALPFLSDDDDETDSGHVISSSAHGGCRHDDDHRHGVDGSDAARVAGRARDRLAGVHRAVGAGVGRAFAGGPLRRVF